MKKVMLLFLLFLHIICNISFAQLADTPWPMLGQNPQHTGRSNSLFSASNTVKWKIQLEGRIESSPVIDAEGTIYIGTINRYLYAINPDGTLKWKFQTGAQNWRNRVFYDAIKKAGIRKIRIHDLRHTYASMLLQLGAPMHYVKDQLGHYSIKVTVDIYGHILPGVNRGIVDFLDEN